MTPKSNKREKKITKRKMRLMKIIGSCSRIEGMLVEGMLLELKRFENDEFFRRELSNVFADLYYLERLARKAP